MSSGPDTSSAGSTGPGRFRALFEDAVVILAATVTVALPAGINPRLLAPSLMVAGAGLGVYALSLYARRRRMS